MPYPKKNFRSGGGGFRKQGAHGGPRTMHDATCGNCGKPCQVPFRPSGEKPVYCRDCFPQMTGSTSNRFGNDDHRISAPAPFRPSAPVVAPVANDEVKKQLEGVNARLERLIALVESAMVSKAEVEPAPKKSKKK